MKAIKKKLLNELDFMILVGITVCVLIICAVAFGSSMYSARNIQSMAFQIPEFGFLALGMMISNLVGGIDLSIIANANTVAIFTAQVLNGTWACGLNGSARILFAILLALGISLLFGFMNGLIIAKTSAPSLVATLGSMTLIQGIGIKKNKAEGYRWIQMAAEAGNAHAQYLFGLNYIEKNTKEAAENN